MMNPVPIVDTTIDMILLVFNAHPSWLDQWDEMAAAKYQTNLMVIKVRGINMQGLNVAPKKFNRGNRVFFDPCVNAMERRPY